ncbi:DJ-1/PfpI family protein [Paraburkholderia sp. GAS32]|jgi:cyclohexyl-isocyanide hydratase|uniref:DJ-1/PfpI family protein n=1 Tax=Paraburkholderia sp. GAS32 TaxID=3035129 RepID=UPI003D1D298B
MDSPVVSFSVGMLVFQGMTNLDFAAPFEVFSRMPGAEVHVIGVDDGVVTCDTGARLLPTTTIDRCPRLDMIFVGGGPGINPLMENPPVLAFLAQAGAQVSWVTSVCTGALLLGAAGLLRGYKAATHWTAMDVLPAFEVTPVYERVVMDRNRITAGGVTAGLDFGLVIAGLLHGEQIAHAIQLGMEYDPSPPFAGGSPRSAPAALVTEVRRRTQQLTDERMEIARRVSAHWPGQ